MKLYLYMQYQDFEEDWICPYCKEKMKKFIRVFEEEKHGKLGQMVMVNYGYDSKSNHRDYCRTKKLLSLVNYHVQELECCSNCAKYEESSIYDKIYDSEGSCRKFNHFVRRLGKCDEFEY